MPFEERSYGGKVFRPRPHVHLESDESLLIVATPWGPRSQCEKAVQTIVDFLQSSHEDIEVTSPFEKLPSLSPTGNNLRVALRLTNDAIYNEDNRDEYTGGIELFVMAKTPTEVCWAQIGQPQVFLDRPGFNLSLLTPHTDLSLELSRHDELLPPLPSQLLGLFDRTNFAIHSIAPQKEDRFLFLSRSTIAPDVFSLTRRSRNIDEVSNVLSEADPEGPFWLGIFHNE